MRNFAELQPQWWSFPLIFFQVKLWRLLYKNVSQIPPLFFSAEKELFSCIYLLKKTPRRTKILISPVWNKILKIWDTLFELIQIEGKCSKKFFKISLSKEAEASGNNREKEPPKKATPKIEKIYVLNIYREYFALPAIQCKWSFFANLY